MAVYERNRTCCGDLGQIGSGHCCPLYHEMHPTPFPRTQGLCHWGLPTSGGRLHIVYHGHLLSQLSGWNDKRRGQVVTTRDLLRSWGWELQGFMRPRKGREGAGLALQLGLPLPAATRMCCPQTGTLFSDHSLCTTHHSSTGPSAPSPPAPPGSRPRHSA